MLKQLFCRHRYYFICDVQRTSHTTLYSNKDTKETTHFIYVRCNKCGKEKELKPIISVGKITR